MNSDTSDGLLAKLAAQLDRTERDEISCDECFELLDEYAEAVHRGEEPAEIMPKVEAHLELCKDCGEEFEALVRALEEVN